MDFLCEDLPQYGLRLIPPSSPEHAPLLADIQRRANRPGEGAPPIPERFRPRFSEEERATSAILLNGAEKTIAVLEVVWRFETVSGRSYRHWRGVLSPQPLLPFSIPEKLLKVYRYWNTILPGSKRYLSESGIAGDNTDVRPPEPEEKWFRGGSGAGGGMRSIPEPVQRVTLALDGVFFLDGEFVGPDRGKLYEQTVAQAEANMLVAEVARNGRNNGLTPARILSEIEALTGPPPEHLPSENYDQRWALQRLAQDFAMRRKSGMFTDEQIVGMIVGWADTVLPRFRKV